MQLLHNLLQAASATIYWRRLHSRLYFGCLTLLSYFDHNVVLFQCHQAICLLYSTGIHRYARYVLVPRHAFWERWCGLFRIRVKYCICFY